MKKAVGIITLNGYTNYGNRLQNYALQEALKEIDCDSQTILIDGKGKQDTVNPKISIVTRLINKINRKRYELINANRVNKFISFSKMYINETDYKIGQNVSSEINKKFDYFITGSDQVWNPYFITGLEPIYFLNFADKDKRISYAASFGVSDIPNELLNLYQDLINGMNHISVREEDGKRLVKEISSKESFVVVDPTLLLTKESWLSISKTHLNKPKGKFLLTYFLGKIPKDVKRYIKQVAKQNNLQIVNLSSLNDKIYYDADPSEFLDYIATCEVMFTDSFHGTVFSILFNKPFVVCNRIDKISMNSRIDTLLKLFNLHSRRWGSFSKKDNLFNVDFSSVETSLETKRREAFNFLKTSLDVNN